MRQVGVKVIVFPPTDFMRTGFFRVSFALVAVFVSVSAYAASDVMSASDLVAKGEVPDRKLQASDALGFYLAAEKIEPKNPHLMVCIARQYRHLMTDAPTKKEKLGLGRVA